MSLALSLTASTLSSQTWVEAKANVPFILELFTMVVIVFFKQQVNLSRRQKGLGPLGSLGVLGFF